MATLNELKMLFSNRSVSDVAIEISGFTGFRTTLIDELTQEEINKLYRIHTAKFIDNEAEKRYWISCILSIATKEGLHYPVMIEKNGRMIQDDWHKFNTWMLTKSTVHKLLFLCSLEELKAVHQQLCKLRDNNKKSSQKPFNKAWMRKAIRNKNLN
ncbi:MAG: hypothetical protein D8B49_01005 [Riemerella sp.]|jgi:hypothetical protein|uniref:Uncharacterized protein n=1 Tax=Myoviridae sp. ctQV19 TaxID=2827607 RepID=A0A8S5RSM4_9CAUD|nr:MAG: hypothetical protein D8B49_01005 [Riemerella sp.]DAE92504.1 MAG TPA: hypothetical protein [Myoviridae sp. ctQV19]